LLLVAGVVVAVVSHLQIAGPSAVVRSYFSALRTGDAAKALSFGAAPSGNTSYLTSAVVQAQSRLGVLGEPTLTSVTHSGDTARVGVTYTVGTKTLTDQITLHRTSRHWQMDATTASVSVDVGAAAHRATMSGLDLPTGAIDLFPGAVPVVYDTPDLSQSPTSDLVSLSATGVLRVRAQLTDAGSDAVVQSLRAAMTACLGQGAQAPASCPLTPTADRAVPGSLRGTIATVDAPNPATLVTGDADGLVELDATISVTGTWSVLDFNNLAVKKTGTAVVPVTGRTYITAPQSVLWVTT
jgi:hypothetical protein